MTRRIYESQFLTYRLQTVVFPIWEDAFAIRDRIERRSMVIKTHRFELLLEDAVIKTDVVGYKRAVLCNLDDAFGQLIEFWCGTHHFIRNAGQFCNVRINTLFRVDKRNQLVHYFALLHYEYGNINNSFGAKGAASTFYIYYSKFHGV